MPEPPEAEEDSSPPPGAIGALVSVANSKPFTALLSPTFTALGEYWGERTTDWVARLREKRARNIDRHRERVLTTEPRVKHDGPSEMQAALAIEWTETAQTIDPDQETDLAALWQGMLGSIYRDEDNLQEMLAALKQLNRKEATLLLDLSHGWITPRTSIRSRYEKLERCGLVSRFSWSAISYQLRQVTLVVVLASVLFVVVVPEYMTLATKISEFDQLVRPVAILVGIVLPALFLVPLFGRFGAFRLTELGEQLQQSGLRYRQEHSASPSPPPAEGEDRAPPSARSSRSSSRP